MSMQQQTTCVHAQPKTAWTPVPVRYQSLDMQSFCNVWEKNRADQPRMLAKEAHCWQHRRAAERDRMRMCLQTLSAGMLPRSPRDRHTGCQTATVAAGQQKNQPRRRSLFQSPCRGMQSPACSAGSRPMFCLAKHRTSTAVQLCTCPPPLPQVHRAR